MTMTQTTTIRPAARTAYDRLRQEQLATGNRLAAGINARISVARELCGCANTVASVSMWSDLDWREYNLGMRDINCRVTEESGRIGLDRRSL